jgi:hypothetical protein
MTITVCAIALALLVMFAGGPNEFMHVLNRAVQSVGAALLSAYHNFRV